MNRQFIFSNDVRIETSEMAPSDAVRLGSAIGRTIAAAVMMGSVVTVSCPNAATARTIANAVLQPVKEAMPHTVIQHAPESVTEATIAAVHAKASARTAAPEHVALAHAQEVTEAEIKPAPRIATRQPVVIQLRPLAAPGAPELDPF